MHMVRGTIASYTTLDYVLALGYDLRRLHKASSLEHWSPVRMDTQISGRVGEPPVYISFPIPEVRVNRVGIARGLLTARMI